MNRPGPAVSQPLSTPRDPDSVPPTTVRLARTPELPSLRAGRLLVWLLALVFSAQWARAQAPSTLADFNGRVLTMTSSTTGNPGFYPATAIRFSAARPPEFTGNLLLAFPPTGGPTNASYTAVSGTEGTLQLVRYATAVDWETNVIALTFSGPGAGTYANTIRRSGITQAQTNTGTFSLVTGTNITPRIALQTGSPLIVQPGINVGIAINVTVGWDVRYQWRQNGTNVPGATANFLNFINLQSAQTGAYTCELSNAVGVVTSAVIQVSLAEPIVFVREPQDVVATEFSWVALEADVTGSVQNYAWYKNGSYFSGGTNRLVFPIVTLADAGSYQLVVENFGRSATSRVARVNVQTAAPEWTWLDRTFRRVAVEGMAVPGAPGHTFAGWGSPALTPLITYKDGKVHFVAGTTAGVRSLFRWSQAIGQLETLVFTNTARPDGGVFQDTYYPTDEGAGTVNFVGVGTGMYARDNLAITSVIGTNTPAPGRPGFFVGGPGSFGRRGTGVAISATVVNSPGSFSAVGAGIFFHDGSVLTRIADETSDLPGAVGGYGGRPSGNAVNFDGTTIVFSTVASLAPGAQGGFYKATPAGVITKLADYTDNRPGSTTVKFTGFTDLDVDGEYIFGVANNTAWRFATDGSVTNVGSASAVSAAGPRMAYYGTTALVRRWNNGTNLTALQTGRILDGRSVNQILAFDGQGDDLAVLVRFTDLTHGIYLVGGPVPAKPVIAREPLDTHVMEQATAIFTISVEGAAPMSVQWRKDGVDIPNATGTYFEIPGVAPVDEGGYSAVVSNAGGSVTSRVATLTMERPTRPVIWAQPFVPPLYFGSNGTLTVTAVGQAPLHYQWFKSTNGVDAPIAGATGPSLLLSGLSPADKASYFVVVTNAAGGVTSSAATVGALLPWITIPPASTTNSVGGTVTFTVSALGVAPFSYQWLKTSPTTLLSGETSATLTLANLTTNQAGGYMVRVISPDGSTLSPEARLTVLSGTVATAPILGQPVVAAGNLTFPLPTQTGFTYQVQSKLNLSDPEWVVEKTVTGDGTTQSVSVGAAGTTKFVRVVVLP